MANPWTRFCAEMRWRSPDNEWVIDGAYPTNDLHPMALLRSPERPFLFLTKNAFHLWLSRNLDEAREADHWVRNGLPTREFLNGLENILWPYSSIRFVGDLDPCDLGNFRSLQCGSPDLVPRKGWKLRFEYAGVHSGWFELARKYDCFNINYTIKMGRLEREQYRALRATWPELPDVVGAEAFALLESGRKLELEALAPLVKHDSEALTEASDLIFGGDPLQRTALRAIVSGSAADARSAKLPAPPTALEQHRLARCFEDTSAKLHNRVAAVRAYAQAGATVQPWRAMTLATGAESQLSLREAAATALVAILPQVNRRSSEYGYIMRDLLGTLRCDDPGVRFVGAWMLGELRERSALPHLAPLAKSDSAKVRGQTVAEAAAAAMRSIREKHPGPGPSVESKWVRFGEVVRKV